LIDLVFVVLSTWPLMSDWPHQNTQVRIKSEWVKSLVLEEEPYARHRQSLAGIW